MFNTLKKSTLAIVIFSLLAGLALLALPSGAVAASPSEQTGAKPQANQPDRQPRYWRIETAWQVAKTAYHRQGQLIDRRLRDADRVQKLVERLKAAGKDVSALESALATFRAGMTEAQAAYANTGALVDAHAGFNPGGQVTDREQALQTLKDTRAGLKATQQIIRDSTRAFLEVVRQYKEANGLVKDGASARP